jgi:IS30 family transposase
MDRDRLKGYLDEGLSLAQIGALENRHPSTIRWWLNRYGLEPSDVAPRHSAPVGIAAR